MNIRNITPEIVRRAFLAGGKRHLLLTGSRGSGKSTLLEQLVPAGSPGIITWAEPKSAVYLKDRNSDDTVRIGCFDPDSIGCERRMKPEAAGFLTLGNELIRNCIDSSERWAVIDEIGYLESSCPEYCDALRQLFDEKNILAVVRRNGSDFGEELLNRDDVFVVDLDDPYGRAGCVIMASGLGKRFGGNKLMADFCGKPLMQYALDSTDSLFGRRVAVTRHRNAEELCERQGIDVILHDLPHRSDTIRLGVERIGGDTDCCMFCQGDQPLLKKETVAAMLLLYRNCGGVIRASYGDTAGSPVLFPAELYGRLMTLPEGKGGGVLVKEYPERVRCLPVSQPEELTDADTPEDMEKLKNVFTGKGEQP